MSDTSAQPQNLFSRVSLHIPLLILGIVVAVAIGESKVMNQLAAYGPVGYVLTSFVLGAMYSSLFTVAPATVGFVHLATAGVPVSVMGICGGIGAMLGDLSMFQVIKFGLTDNLVRIFQAHSRGLYEKLFRIRFFKILLVIVGIVIVATPIPDEMGLAIMGLGKARWRTVAIIGFVFNALGIAGIGLLAR